VERRPPGCKPPDSVKKGRYSPPLSVPIIENRCTSEVLGQLRIVNVRQCTSQFEKNIPALKCKGQVQVGHSLKNG
jgi:hypothetical protein